MNKGLSPIDKTFLYLTLSSLIYKVKILFLNKQYKSLENTSQTFIC